MTRRLVLLGKTVSPLFGTFLMVVANDPIWKPQEDPNLGDEPYIDFDDIRKRREESKHDEN